MREQAAETRKECEERLRQYTKERQAESDRKGEGRDKRPRGGKVAFDRCIFFEHSFKPLTIGPRVHTCIS